MLVYKATNINNNKAYIGVTSKSLSIRRKQHLYSARKNSDLHFHRALRKYGEEGFVWEVIYKGANVSDLYNKEVELISKFDSFKKGYNSTIGGEGSKGGSISKDRDKEWRLKQSKSHICKSKEFKTRVSDNESIYTIKQREEYANIQKGELNSMAKLSKADVFEIYRLWDTGKYTMTELSKIFPVDRRHIGRIVKGLTRVGDYKEYYE